MAGQQRPPFDHPALPARKPTLVRSESRPRERHRSRSATYPLWILSADDLLDDLISGRGCQLRAASSELVDGFAGETTIVETNR